jgi:hypothetical protein
VTQYKRIASDTSKSVFTVHCIDAQDRPARGEDWSARLRLLNKRRPFRPRPERCSPCWVNRSKRSAPGSKKSMPECRKASAVRTILATIPGVGPITALTLATEMDPVLFESGRHLAAWVGLTPKEHSTGGKQRMGKITVTGAGLAHLVSVDRSPRVPVPA